MGTNYKSANLVQHSKSISAGCRLFDITEMAEQQKISLVSTHLSKIT